MKIPQAKLAADERVTFRSYHDRRTKKVRNTRSHRLPTIDSLFFNPAALFSELVKKSQGKRTNLHNLRRICSPKFVVEVTEGPYIKP
jgi:hypothetical protein